MVGGGGEVAGVTHGACLCKGATETLMEFSSLLLWFGWRGRGGRGKRGLDVMLCTLREESQTSDCFMFRDCLRLPMKSNRRHQEPMQASDLETNKLPASQERGGELGGTKGASGGREEEEEVVS